VVRRAPGAVQVGIDPKHAVVIDSLPEALVDELITLDGRHTVAELGERLKSRGEDPTQLGEVLASLDEAGLLDGESPAQGGTAAVQIGRASCRERV